MGSEIREQAEPATPILNSILGELPPPSIRLATRMRLNVVTDAWRRLSEKVEDGTVTKKDIENELASLPADINGIEEGKVQLVRLVQMNLSDFSIDNLPAE